MTHLVMAINAGSSSLKFQLFAMPEEQVLTKGIVERIGKQDAIFRLKLAEGTTESVIAVTDHRAAVALVLQALISHGIIHDLDEIEAVGHRVAHGGEAFQDARLIDDAVLQQIEQLAVLAPLHNPVNVMGIRAFQTALPHARAVAVFDTAFHQTMPATSYLYGLPYRLYEEQQIRRYGFHGPSHQYVSQQAAHCLERPLEDLRLITCHLGNGSSLCAIRQGQSIHTSMGFTPEAGVLMGTRCGDLDPSILLHLQRTLHLDLDQLDHLLNQESGLLGISGVSNDYRDVESAAAQGNQRAVLAIEMFALRIQSYIGSYLALLGGLDALIFTGGIGENSARARRNICQGMEELGIVLDPTRNEQSSTFIQRAGNRIAVMVIPTNEELMIARDVMRVAL